jgi:hypothetical protein
VAKLQSWKAALGSAVTAATSALAAHHGIERQGRRVGTDMSDSSSSSTPVDGTGTAAMYGRIRRADIRWGFRAPR